MRIAIAGFQHETNTFAPTVADYEAFWVAKAFPPLVRGHEMLAAVRGKKLPSAGAIRVLEASRGCADSLDGILLELHGAMVARHVDDGEGELLARVRSLVGPGVPISVPLDLHANVTPEMVDQADYLDLYRYYPHIDMAKTGARAAAMLLRMIRSRTEELSRYAAFDFHKWIATNIFVPLLPFMNPLVYLTELSLAVAFMLRFMVRPLGVVGMLFVVHLWLGLYQHPHEWPWLYIFLIFVQGFFVLDNAGKSLGLDALIARAPVAPFAGDGLLARLYRRVA